MKNNYISVILPIMTYGMKGIRRCTEKNILLMWQTEMMTRVPHTSCMRQDNNKEVSWVAMHRNTRNTSENESGTLIEINAGVTNPQDLATHGIQL